MRKIHYTKGFTLAELLVSVAIIGLIIGVIATFQVDTFKNNRVYQSKLLATDDARGTLHSLLNEARSATQSSTGTYAITLAQNDSFIFYSDPDHDGLKDRIRYFVSTSSGMTLKKGVVKPTGSPLTYVLGNEVLSTVVHTLATTTNVFSYYDTNDALMSNPATPSLVRSIRVNLLISTGIVNGATTTEIYETRATFRNLKDNY